MNQIVKMVSRMNVVSLMMNLLLQKNEKSSLKKRQGRKRREKKPGRMVWPRRKGRPEINLSMRMMKYLRLQKLKRTRRGRIKVRWITEATEHE